MNQMERWCSFIFLPEDQVEDKADGDDNGRPKAGALHKRIFAFG
jgi:hypothetical protein